MSREIVKNELSAANQQQAFGIAVLLLVLIISPVIIFLVSWNHYRVNILKKCAARPSFLNTLTSGNKLQNALNNWRPMALQRVDHSTIRILQNWTLAAKASVK